MLKRQVLIEIALRQFGHREIAGQEDNPEVLKYFDETDFDGKRLKDETSWCSAFVNWVALKSGCDYSGRLNAKSWLGVGRPVDQPHLGDVVVLWREHPKSWKGHVGLFIRQTPNWVYLLGGNQGNRVSIQAYRRHRVLGYRDIT